MREICAALFVITAKNNTLYCSISNKSTAIAYLLLFSRKNDEYIIYLVTVRRVCILCKIYIARTKI